MKEPVYFLKLELKNIRCFGEKATLDLSDSNVNWRRWTVILGDNGTGKTTLLQLLAILEQKKSPFAASKKGEYISKLFDFPSFDFKRRDKKHDAECNGYINYPTDKKYIEDKEFVGISERANNKYGSLTKVSEGDIFENLKVFGYGANRFMSNRSIIDSKSENSETLFNEDAKLINAEEWLLQLDYAASKDSEIKNFAIKKRNQVKQILQDLLPDVKKIRFSKLTKENLKSTVEFQTPFGWVTIHQLSLGYKTMVAWMVDLAARLFERYPDSDNPLAEPAIVLVDEIDLHLHPKWQRNIFDYLSDKFPQTQFIVTAHSPLVVQSAPKDANIVVLRKEGDHVVIDNDVKSVQNWRLDQILSSDLFGGIPVRNNEVESILKRRNELMGHASLSTAEQKELDALNKEIDKLPYAESEVDIEAKEIIRKAAEYFKLQGVH